MREIYDSEHNYISQINTIVTLFLKPIRFGSIIPPEICNIIFSNIEGILSVNQELFNYMRQRGLGEAFAFLAPFLKLYSSYANNFQEASDTLHKWTKQNNEFHLFVKAQEARPECCRLTLAALLLAPIQRIPRYKLLLEKLLKHTKDTHPDYARLSAATEQLEAIGTHINEYIRQHENFHKMLSIQNSLTGDSVPTILVPGRRFIKEGRLMKICRRRPKERIIFLFSDILIYGRPNILGTTESYEYRGSFHLASSSVDIEFGSTVAPGVNVLFKVSDPGMSLVFFCREEHDTYKWVEALVSTIKQLQPVIPNQQEVPMRDNVQFTINNTTVNTDCCQGNQRRYKAPRPKSSDGITKCTHTSPVRLRPHSAGDAQQCTGMNSSPSALNPGPHPNSVTVKDEDAVPLLEPTPHEHPVLLPAKVQSACCSIA